MAFPKTSILGTSIAAVDYEGACEEIFRLAKLDRPSAVAAANTHLVTVARQDPSFRKILSQFDLIVPDGMPLVWVMRLKKISQQDRVYGPYLMKMMIEKTPRPWKHFLFGGSEKMLRDLSNELKKLQPQIDLVGAIAPPFGDWSQEMEVDFARQIQAANPDFIWVALGGERQEKWIEKNLPHHERGVFLAVGDAFPLLAGHRPFAPHALQSLGLTWLYRLIQEPRRLGARYFKYNTLFLFYLGLDFFCALAKREKK